METANTKRVLEIVGYALEKGGRELESYLDSVCGEDSLLRSEVLNYLEYDVKGSVFVLGSIDVTAPEIPDATNLETRYDVGDEIARGGMGVILRAYDRYLRRDVAIKVLKEGKKDAPDTLRRFIQEAQIGGQLQHPGIAPVYDIGRLPDQRPFIAMKLVKGKTLATLLSERSDVADDQARLLGVFEQVCQAIAFAQTSGVIHRDLKPANVMVGEFGEVQVMDWGLAKIIGDGQPEEACDDAGESVVQASAAKVDTDSDAYRTRVGHVMGTPAYMPPEQPFGLSDEKTDVFSLGAILCEILTGKPTACDLDAARDRLNRSKSDPELTRLATDCIEQSPARRPKDASVVAAKISAHFNMIQSRLRDAEIATARAEVIAAEERRLRQRTLWTVAVVATLLVGASLVGWLIRNSVLEQRSRDLAEGLVKQLLSADFAQIPAIVEQIDSYRMWADPLLASEYAKSADGSVERVRLALALLPVEEGHSEYLRDQLLACTLEQLPVVRAALLPHKDGITDSLWLLAQNDQHDVARRFQASAALAEYDPDDERWEKLAPFVAQHLTSAVPTVYVDDWLRLFQPTRDVLTDPLAAIHADRSRTERQREEAALGLAVYSRDKPDKLADVTLAADEFAEFSVLIDALGPHSAAVKQQLITEMRAETPDSPAVDKRDTHWKRQSMAAVTLVHLGYGEEVWPLLEFTPDPSLRSFIVHHLGKLKVDHNTLAARLEAESEVSIRRALIQSLGGLDSAEILPTDRNRIGELLKMLYANDPDPGIHSSALWTLQRWGIMLPTLAVEAIADIEEFNQRPAADEREDLPLRQAVSKRELQEKSTELAAHSTADRRWHINSQGQTMVVIPDPSKFGNSLIDHDFAISSHEVTVDEYRRFQEQQKYDRSIAPSDDCPMNRVTWFMAAEYCNWLSQQEGIPENQRIYEPNEDGKFADGMRIKKNFFELGGYRLPTQDEWEHACLAGARGPYSFGEPVVLLKEYGRYLQSSSGRTHPVGSLLPNDTGLFDMHGNLWEWTQNPVSGPLSPVASSGRRLLCGGAFITPSGLVRSEIRDWSQAINQPFSFGFRVARTHHLSSP